MGAGEKRMSCHSRCLGREAGTVFSKDFSNPSLSLIPATLLRGRDMEGGGGGPPPTRGG